MRKFTPNLQTNALLNSSATIFDPSRYIRTRVRKQKESEFFDFRKDFPNLYKLYNHIDAYGIKHPFKIQFFIFFGVFTTLHTITLPAHITGINKDLREIKWTLRDCEKRLKGSSDDIDKLPKEIKSIVK